MLASIAASSPEYTLRCWGEDMAKEISGKLRFCQYAPVPIRSFLEDQSVETAGS